MTYAPDQIAGSGDEMKRKKLRGILETTFYVDAPPELAFTLDRIPAFQKVMDFYVDAAMKFGLDVEEAFSPERNIHLSDFFKLLQQRIDRMREKREHLRYFRKSRRYPRNLYPGNSDGLQDFADLFSFFIHYGMRRGVEDRAYTYHTEEVQAFMEDFFEAFSNSLLCVASLHDTVEDFAHKPDPDIGEFPSFLLKMGLRDDQKSEFRIFLLKYYDSIFPPVEYPKFLEYSNPIGGSTASAALFRRLVAEHAKFSDMIFSMTKFEGAIPGHHKDRYRDVLSRLSSFFESPDLRIAFLRFIYYLCPKAGDTASNYFSYGQQTHVEVSRGPSDPMKLKKKRAKERQMRGITQHVALSFFQRTGAWIGDYYLRDALRFPNYQDREDFQKVVDEYETEQHAPTLRDTFIRELETYVAEKYLERYGKELHPYDWNVKLWHRALKEIRPDISRAVQEKKPPAATKFLNIVDVRILTLDLDRAEKVRSVIASFFASRAPHVESSVTFSEKEHPFIKACSIRSDRLVRPSSVGYVVVSNRNLAEARSKFGGIIPTVFLGPSGSDTAVFNRFMHQDFIPLGRDVAHLEELTRKVETELKALSTCQVDRINDATRSRVAQTLRYFRVVDGTEIDSSPGMFGDIPEAPAAFLWYVRFVSEYYKFLKEQVLTLLKPRIHLSSFEVQCGDQAFPLLADISLPKDASVQYALAYLFPQFLNREVQAISVVRKQRKKGRLFLCDEHVDRMKQYSLEEGDVVRVVLSDEEGNYRLSPILNVLRYSREFLYPTTLGPTP